MNELQERILEITRQPHLASLATIAADGKPWVRYVIPRADENLIFRVATRLHSRKVAQIQQNPEVHLTCGVTDPRQVGTFLQIQGRAELSCSQQERESFWDPHLERAFEGPDDPEYGVLRITPSRIELWEEENPDPEVWEA